MCDFILRPIKSYATVEITAGGKTFKRGDVVTVKGISEDGVAVYMGDTAIGTVVKIPINVFIHAFIAGSKDIDKVKQEEQSWFK